MLRRIALAVGLVFAALGLAIAVAPDLATTLRLPEVPTLVVGAVAAVLALSAYFARRHTGFRDASDVASRNEFLEGRFEPPRPGADVDAQFGDTGGSRFGGSSDAHFTDRVRQLAVQVLVDARGVSREEAREQLEQGTWTDNETAAAFFADHIEPPAEDVVGTVVGFESMYERQAQNVVLELERIAGLDEGDA